MSLVEPPVYPLAPTTFELRSELPWFDNLRPSGDLEQSCDEKEEEAEEASLPDSVQSNPNSVQSKALFFVSVRLPNNDAIQQRAGRMSRLHRHRAERLRAVVSQRIERQGIGPSAIEKPSAPHQLEEAQSSDELWNQLLSPSTSAEAKAEALEHLIAEGAQGVIGFVLSELGKETIQPDWRDKLIFAAEQIEIKDPATRTKVKQLLHRHAAALLQSGRFRSETALWAAIRRYASLIEETEAQTLQHFLEGKASIATRQVTLQAICAIFQQAPPGEFDELGSLVERVQELATKYVDRDLLVSPENTSLALNAFITLSAMGTSSSKQLATRMKEIGNPWLLRRGGQILEGLLRTWRSNGQLSTKQKTAIQNVSDSLSELRHES